MWVMSSGARPPARRLSGSLPNVGCMVLPAPASMRTVAPSRWNRKLLTGMKTEPSGCAPASAAASLRSMSKSRSSDVLSMPSSKTRRSRAPMRTVRVMSESLARQRDHAACRDDDRHRKAGEAAGEAAAELQHVSHEEWGGGADDLGDEGA